MFCETSRRGAWEHISSCICHNYKTIRKEIQDKKNQEIERKQGNRVLAETFLRDCFKCLPWSDLGITQLNFHSEKSRVHVSFIDQTNLWGESVTASGCTQRCGCSHWNSPITVEVVRTQQRMPIPMAMKVPNVPPLCIMVLPTPPISSLPRIPIL